MKTAAGIVALAATANAAYQGFNYGATFSDGTIKTQSDYETEFSAAANLDGTDGAFTSARLYTMIQGSSTDDPIEAIEAAISTGTSLLLGMWASAGAANFANEISALKNAIEQYGDDLASLCAGISVGSEDLYRITETAAQNGETNPGVQPDVLADYISQVRDAISGTVLADAKIGHVDTWTVWANSSNQAVFDAVDWVGMDAYPYFEKEHTNGIENAAELFAEAIAQTNAGTGNKDLWVTETGWPVSGDTIGDAVPGLANAKTFWDEVGCPMFGEVNVWWYTYQDSNPTTPNPSFGVVGSDVSTTPLYDLSCSNTTSSNNSTTGSGTSTSTATGTASGGLTTGTGTGSGYGGSNTTVTTGTLSPTASSSSGSGSSGSGSSGSDSSSGSSGDDTDTVGTSNAAALGHSLGAGVLAIMAAVFAL
ncbi:glucan 1,3-beta-glucosidase [Zalerion maritima]|uniref:Probable glucan endo-1,3-beta-glucosidase eglC n=1 Tax=Zalerion maritima TaxID=339359 RepID=A0AAD5RT90_9PEZI|nr:glucan 1,3-beta-glucosidase [Zalerion maritima]